MNFENYECDRCGACCKGLIVEAGYLDAKREPRLFQINPNITVDDLLEDGAIILWDVEKKGCPFLEDSGCSIYPTRPNACVSVDAGDAKCQQSRLNYGLPLLHDKNGNPPTREMMEESAEEYCLDLSELGFKE